MSDQAALMRRALILIRAYAEDAPTIDRQITCHQLVGELAEALAPRVARLMPPIAENASGNREAVL